MREVPRGDNRTRDREANCRISYPITKEQELDVVEGSAPSETEKEIVHGVGVGNVGPPATPDSFAPTVEKNST
jgi:hypothetical protein